MRLSDHYEPRADRITFQAFEVASRLRHPEADVEHLFLALLADEEVGALLLGLGVDTMEAARAAEARLPPGTAVQHGAMAGTLELSLLLQDAVPLAAELGHRLVHTSHLLLATASSAGLPSDILNDRGVTAARLRAEITRRSPPDAEPEERRTQRTGADLAEALQRVLQKILADSHAGRHTADVPHLVLALLDARGSTFADLLRDAGADPDTVRACAMQQLRR